MTRYFAILTLGAVTAFGATGCVIDSTYTSCFSNGECNAGESCVEVTTFGGGGGVVTDGGFCTYSCTSDFDCEFNLGFEGFCVDPGDGAGFVCAQGCLDDFDCFSRSVCVELDELPVGPLNNVFVCLPDNL